MTVQEQLAQNLKRIQELEARALAAEAKAQAAEAKAQSKDRKLSFKIGNKGGICVVGLNGRFPVTLYTDQWVRLIAVIPELQKFIADNAQAIEHRVKNPIIQPDMQ